MKNRVYYGAGIIAVAMAVAMALIAVASFVTGVL